MGQERRASFRVLLEEEDSRCDMLRLAVQGKFAVCENLREEIGRKARVDGTVARKDVSANSLILFDGRMNEDIPIEKVESWIFFVSLDSRFSILDPRSSIFLSLFSLSSSLPLCFFFFFQRIF